MRKKKLLFYSIVGTIMFIVELLMVKDLMFRHLILIISI